MEAELRDKSEKRELKRLKLEAELKDREEERKSRADLAKAHLALLTQLSKQLGEKNDK